MYRNIWIRGGTTGIKSGFAKVDLPHYLNIFNIQTKLYRSHAVFGSVFVCVEPLKLAAGGFSLLRGSFPEATPQPFHRVDVVSLRHLCGAPVSTELRLTGCVGFGGKGSLRLALWWLTLMISGFFPISYGF